MGTDLETVFSCVQLRLACFMFGRSSRRVVILDGIDGRLGVGFGWLVGFRSGVGLLTFLLSNGALLGGSLGGGSLGGRGA